MTKQILIVEDEMVLQDVYSLILSSSGYHVSIANNGVEAVQKLKTLKPDLILLDLFMPIMDGREFLRNINTEEYPTTKIVVYTNLSDSSTENEMLKLGADKVVLKSSMTPKDLVALVRKMIG